MVSRNCQTLVMTVFFWQTLSLLLPASAANIGFEQLFVFGNSVSDTGNLFSINRARNNPFPPSPLYFQGRFSDGFVWTDYLSQGLGLDPSTFYGDSFTNANDGINFAVGGATTGTTSRGGAEFPGITTQVNDFINFLDGTKVDEEALVIFWGGENDYADGVFNQGVIIEPQTPINNITNSLTDLANADAKNVLVPNLPNLGDTPLGQEVSQAIGDPEIFNNLTTVHNNLLSQRVNDLNTSFPETNFVLFDVNSVISNIFDNPTEFGFNAEPLDACLSPDNFPDIDPNVMRCDNPSEFVFYDNQHFTSQVHRFIADAALETLHESISPLPNNPNPNPTTPVPESKNIVGLLLLGTGLLLGVNKSKH